MIQGVKNLSVSIQLPYVLNSMHDAYYDFGTLEIRCKGRSYITDSLNAEWYLKNQEVIVNFEVSDEVNIEDQDLLPEDLNSNDLEIEFYIGCEYNVDPDSMSLMVEWEGGMIQAIDFV